MCRSQWYSRCNAFDKSQLWSHQLSHHRKVFAVLAGSMVVGHCQAHVAPVITSVRSSTIITSLVVPLDQHKASANSTKTFDQPPSRL
jgi:hypothetical protein